MTSKLALAVTSKLPRFQLPERFKGTIVERWATYWKGLARDYKDVAIDSVKTVREKPLKSGVYGSIGAFVYASCKSNPDNNCFTEQLHQAENSVGLVPLDAQSPKSVEYLKTLNRLRNDETLRITSIGLFSIMWIADFGVNVSTFDATCDYLKPEMKNFHERIIDIGFAGKWWNLEKMMKDYDVNF